MAGRSLPERRTPPSPRWRRATSARSASRCVRGRDFTTADDAGAPPVAIVSEQLRAALLRRSPIRPARACRSTFPGRAVVHDRRRRRRHPPGRTGRHAGSRGLCALRAIGARVLRADAVARGADGARRRRWSRVRCATRCGASIRHCRSCRWSRLDDLRGRSLAQPRFRGFVLGVFALTALALATAGLFAIGVALGRAALDASSACAWRSARGARRSRGSS